MSQIIWMASSWFFSQKLLSLIHFRQSSMLNNCVTDDVIETKQNQLSVSVETHWQIASQDVRHTYSNLTLTSSCTFFAVFLCPNEKNFKLWRARTIVVALELTKQLIKVQNSSLILMRFPLKKNSLTDPIYIMIKQFNLKAQRRKWLRIVHKWCQQILNTFRPLLIITLFYFKCLCNFVAK